MSDLCALQTSNRQWKRLPPELTRQIRKWRFAHPTALMVKQLRFTRLPEQNRTGGGVYDRACLWIEAMPQHSSFLQLVGFENNVREVRVQDRRYFMDDFGGAGYDRYQIDSDRKSGIMLGRVLGTERWGDVAWHIVQN